MNQRYKTLKRARQLNDPQPWDDYRRLRNKLPIMTKKARANLFDEVKSAAAYWRLRKKTSGTTKVSRQAHQLKKDDGTLTTDDTEKATMLDDYFCTIAEKLIGPADEIQQLHAHSRENVDTPTMTSITISQKEIEEKICKLKVKKATGPDGVSARLLKYAGMSIVPSLTSVFKQSAEACKPPDQWKIARVSAAVKKGREEDRTCYRPLSMLSIPSKLMESCVASNITNHVVTQNLLDDKQWAYRKGKSTEQLLIHLTERWREAEKESFFVGKLYVDFTKAFDTVSHNILLQKLNYLGIRGDIWLWLKNYLIKRRQFVRIKGCDSDTHIITHGVPQGSVLGPTLFSLLTNDLPKSLRPAETYLYADVTTIWCISEKMDLITSCPGQIMLQM